MKLSSIFLVCFVLAGCGTDPKVKEPVLVPPPKETVEIPDYLLVKCPMIEKLEQRPYTEGELVQVLKKVINQNEECRTKNSILVNTMSSAFNLKPVPTQPSK